MTAPIPPGDMPLFDGLGVEWNDVVGALPEDKRAELAPRIKERLDVYQPLTQYEDLHKSGITAEQASTALNLFAMIENEPQRVYEAIGQHLGISTKQAKEVVEEIQQADEDEDPRIATMQNQLQTLVEIQLAQRNQTVAQQQQAEADAAIEKEMNGLKKKYNDVDEEEVLMRMLHKNMSAEEAYRDFSAKATQLRTSRPAPMLLGQGGAVPRNAIDPTKLDSKGTKNLVAQMLEHANNERKL